MRKHLTEEQFRRAIRTLNPPAQTVEIARAVLVEGKPQRELAAKMGLTQPRISQSAREVWMAHLGYETVTVTLPRDQAYLVKEWGRAAQRKLEAEK